MSGRGDARPGASPPDAATRTADARAAAFAARTLAWMDRFWDADAGLLGYPSARGSATNPYQQPGVPVVRETATYAAGLLARDGPGDRARADRALGAVLAHQLDAPGRVVHGTWRRSPREPAPGEAPREWIDYDPNWREFVGTAFALALEHADRLPAERVAGMERALRRAVEGTLARGLSPEYTNIALMSAFLLDWTGARLGEPGWRDAGESLGREVVEGYRRAGAFPEHNSPTYYGIDLYGLALWRDRARSERLRAWGAELEGALWRDLVRFYHPGLRNLCGPYTRAYGMDMTRYVAGLGLWIAPWVAPGAAPLPPLGDRAAHGHDFCEALFVGRLGSRPPADVREALGRLAGERRVEQVIVEDPRRVATAWLTRDLMLGGEHSGARPIHWQHHPATLHWRRPGGGVGWIRLVTPAPVDAVAHVGRLEMTIHTGLPWLGGAGVPVWIELGGPEDAPSSAAPPVPPLKDGAVWRLPGLALRLAVAPDPAVASRAEAGAEWRRSGVVFAPGAAPPRLRLAFEVLGTG